jgi:GT2 family glycosyltransferase
VAPVLSVIIPTRNRADVLERTVGLLLEQASDLAHDAEILVVDDGSHAEECDEFARYLAGLGSAAERVRFLKQAPCGPAAARNRALRAAQGSLVLFLGDDILPCPGLLAAHVAAHLERYPNEGVAILGLADLAPEFRDTPFARWWRRRNFRYDALLSGKRKPDIGFFFTNNLSLKRDFLLKYGMFDEAFPAAAYEDVELAHRLSNHGLDIIFLPEAEAYHYHRIDLDAACRRMETRGRYYDLFWQRTHYPAVSKAWAWAARGPWMHPRFIGPLWLLVRKLESRVSFGPANVLVLMYFFLVGRGLRPSLR